MKRQPQIIKVVNRKEIAIRHAMIFVKYLFGLMIPPPKQ